MKNILQMLENDAKTYPEKIAFEDINSALTYSELLQKSKELGSYIFSMGIKNKPVVILLRQSVQTIVSMLGILYSGNFYCVLDYESPVERVQSIINTLEPELIITDKESVIKASKTYNLKSICIDDISEQINEQALQNIRSTQADTDPAYVLFTSGSTGVPKGAVLSHLNVLKYSQWLVKTFNYNENTVLGNQTPFYFSMSVSDIFGALRCGAQVQIIPKMYFSFPLKLLQYLNEKKINTIYWVPTALCIVANWKALDYVDLPDLKKVLFAGEVMPVKQLNMWMDKLPDALFANLFGPTETTDICTYFVLNRRLSNDESVPIGKACDNCPCMVIKEDGTLAKDAGDSGELYARGSFLAAGYYNNPEKTAAAFVQNPLNKAYPENVYKTGDIVSINDYGELIYLSRADYQIKHMGYRIELGEIETAANSIDKINFCACVYDKENDEIILVYQGRKIDNDFIADKLSEKLPYYMMPTKLFKVKDIPFNANGKIDRKWILNNYKTFEE